MPKPIGEPSRPTTSGTVSVWPLSAEAPGSAGTIVFHTTASLHPVTGSARAEARAAVAAAGPGTAAAAAILISARRCKLSGRCRYPPAGTYPGEEPFRSQYPVAAGNIVWQRVAWGVPSNVSAAARQTA